MDMKDVKRCKVSVIIPVYNAEKYLKQMLSSVVCQTLKDIEIICVDDGSTDRSADIIRRFMKKDERIILLEQDHINAGAARNHGLKIAKGQYVVFWDTDDRFDKRALEIMYHKALNKKADICLCGACEFTDDGKVYETNFLRTNLLPEKDPFNRFDVSGNVFDMASNFAWNKMFRRDFLLREKLEFQEIRQANDTAFVMLSLYLAQTITFVEKRLVYYRAYNKESLTGRASETIFCPYESYMYTLEKLKQYPDFEMVKKDFQNKAVKGLFHSLNIQTSFVAYKKLYEFLKNEGFEKMGLYECREEDMDEAWMYEDMLMLKSSTAEEFLLRKANRRRIERDHLKYTLMRVRRRLAVLLRVNEWLKKIKR